MTTEPLSAAIASTRAILAQVTDADLGKPTPCQSWTVRELVNHVVGGAHYFAAVASTGVATAGPEVDWSAGDRVGAYDEGAAAAVAAFGAPGAQEMIMKLPFGDLPGAIFQGIATMDTFTHGWDLARAIGVPFTPPEELSAQLLGMAQFAISDQFRGPDGQAPFGAATAAPEGASTADQVAAFLGRTV